MSVAIGTCNSKVFPRMDQLSDKCPWSSTSTLDRCFSTRPALVRSASWLILMSCSQIVIQNSKRQIRTMLSIRHTTQTLNSIFKGFPSLIRLDSNYILSYMYDQLGAVWTNTGSRGKLYQGVVSKYLRTGSGTQGARKGHAVESHVKVRFYGLSHC